MHRPHEYSKTEAIKEQLILYHSLQPPFNIISGVLPQSVCYTVINIQLIVLIKYIRYFFSPSSDDLNQILKKFPLQEKIRYIVSIGNGGSPSLVRRAGKLLEMKDNEIRFRKLKLRLKCLEHDIIHLSNFHTLPDVSHELIHLCGKLISHIMHENNKVYHACTRF